MAGLGSNIVDRVAHGAVIDFLDVRWGGGDRGLVFNPADVALAAGLVVLARLLWREATPPRPARG